MRILNIMMIIMLKSVKLKWVQTTRKILRRILNKNLIEFKCQFLVMVTSFLFQKYR